MKLWTEILGTLRDWGFPWWLRWQRICVQGKRPGFSPLVRKVPWRRERLPTPVFFPGESMDRGAWVYSRRDFEESDMAERLSHRRDSVVLLGLPEWETSAFPCPGGPRGEAAPRGDCCVVRTERRWVSSENCLPGALGGWCQLPVTHQRGSQRNTYHDPSLLLPSDPLPELARERNQTGRQRTEHTHRSAL